MHMVKKGIFACICLIAATTVYAEKITLKPNWGAGEKKSYSVEQYTDTAKVASADMDIKILEDKNNYKITCIYSNHHDYTGMEELAKMMIGEAIYDKINNFAPLYTASKEGAIISIDNFDEYRKIFETASDTTGETPTKFLSGLMQSILKSMIAADEKSFMNISMKEVQAMHKFFGKKYNTKKESIGTTEITSSAMSFGSAKSTTAVKRDGNNITFKTTAALPEKECLEAISAWTKKYMEEAMKESGLSVDDKIGKQKIEEMINDYKEKKMTAELEESAMFDAQTGWMISYKCVQVFKSTDGTQSETLVVKAK